MTATVLPLACCTTCYIEKKENCDTFVKSDFTIDCSTQEFQKSVIVAYCIVFYITLLPTAALLILWRQRNTLKTSADDIQAWKSLMD